MTAEVLLQYADGSQEVKRVLLPASAQTTLTVPAKEKPVLVSFDPYRRLIRRLDENEAPPSLKSAWGGFTHYVFDNVNSALSKGGEAGSSAPSDLGDCALVGMPGQSQTLDALAAKAGFVLNGSQLTYDGTTVDLNHNAAMALVNLEGGKRCLIALGRPDLMPNGGDAYLVVTDHIGRFLRGKTLPKTSGRFVFKL